MKEINFVGHQGMGGLMILKINLERYGVRIWTGFRWLKTGDTI